MTVVRFALGTKGVVAFTYQQMPGIHDATYRARSAAKESR
jgi:hypothetical protein